MTTPENWRTGHANTRLIGYRCPHCDWIAFPERKRACKRCGSAPVQMEPFEMKPYGRVISYVIQHRLPSGFETPLPLAIIELDEGARLAGHLIECDIEKLHVGFEVEADFRIMYTEHGLTTHSFKFKPRSAV